MIKFIFAKISILKQRKIIQFFLMSGLVAAATLYIVFSFNRCAVEVQVTGSKVLKFTSLLPQADDVPNVSHPVGVPAPALSGERSGSLKQGFGNKYSNQATPGFTERNRPVFFLHKNEVAKLARHQPRLHLAFCVFRI
jgi:hypothetical protein